MNRTLFIRTQERTLSDKDSTIYNRLHNCKLFKHIQDIHNLPDIFMQPNSPPSNSMNKEFSLQAVRRNTKVLDSDDNWNLLLYKEAYYIKRLTPSLNNGLKSSRELCLFS
jgi:hypothetical protein